MLIIASEILDIVHRFNRNELADPSIQDRRVVSLGKGWADLKEHWTIALTVCKGPKNAPFHNRYRLEFCDTACLVASRNLWSKIRCTGQGIPHLNPRIEPSGPCSIRQSSQPILSVDQRALRLTLCPFWQPSYASRRKEEIDPRYPLWCSCHVPRKISPQQIFVWFELDD